mmetsp:Transcript_66754/g.217313  ORF Transcript_66754/g.217313 Transcript_66754/m.217313 type:complete len:281 (-) Transcript_66754:1693-2535(-)
MPDDCDMLKGSWPQASLVAVCSFLLLRTGESMSGDIIPEDEHARRIMLGCRPTSSSEERQSSVVDPMEVPKATAAASLVASRAPSRLSGRGSGGVPEAAGDGGIVEGAPAPVAEGRARSKSKRWGWLGWPYQKSRTRTAQAFSNLLPMPDHPSALSPNISLSAMRPMARAMTVTPCAKPSTTSPPPASPPRSTLLVEGEGGLGNTGRARPRGMSPSSPAMRVARTWTFARRSALRSSILPSSSSCEACASLLMLSLNSSFSASPKVCTEEASRETAFSSP